MCVCVCTPQDNHTLTSLSLSHSSLGGDAGGAALASAVRFHTSLTRVCVVGCGLGPDGLVALCNAVAESKTLTHIGMR